MERDDLPFPLIACEASGVRILLNSKRIVETITQSKHHPLDDNPMLKSMQHMLRLLFIRKTRGDKKAEGRLFEIHRILYPKAHAISEPIERALDVRHLMCELSYLSKPANASSKTILSGPIQLVESASSRNPKLYEIAAKHLKKGATLKSLAVRIFLQRMRRRKIATIDEKKIESDLTMLREWDDKPTGGKSREALSIIFSTNEHLPYQFHAQKYLKRKRTPRNFFAN